MFCPICGEYLDEYNGELKYNDNSTWYTCPKGCFEEDHPLVKRTMGDNKKVFALFYYAGPPPISVR